jgi:hypothetical protein
MYTPYPSLISTLLSSGEMPKLCACNMSLDIYKGHPFRISQVLFFGAHTPQEYYC